MSGTPGGEGAGGSDKAPVAQKEVLKPAASAGGEGDAPKEQHKFPYYKDTHNSETPDNFLKKYPEQGKLADDLVEQAKDKLLKQESESDVDYQTRVYNELERRLKFPGDYVGTQDELFTTVQNHPDMDQPWYTLMAVEAKQSLHLQAENKRLEEDAKNRLGRIFRRDVKTEVVHEGEPSYIEGDYEHYFDENPVDNSKVEYAQIELAKSRELPKTDLYALTLVADRLLDIVDPATQAQGESKSYRDQMKALEDAMKDGSATQKQKDQTGRKLISLRSQFYSMAIEAMRTVDQPQYVNPDPAAQLPKDKVLLQMYDKLKAIRNASIEELADQYQGVSGTKMTDKHFIETMRLLSEYKPQLLEFALKGADLMQRRISYNPKLHEVPDKIHYKKFVQGGDEDVEQPRILTTPPVRKPEEGEGETEKKLPPAPPTEEEGEEKQPEDLSPAPEEEEEIETPKAPEPAPIPEEPPPSELILGAAALYDRRVQNVYQLADHSFAHDLQRMPVPGIARIPLFGPVLWGIRHPIKLVWQNGLARTVFKQQHIRFASDMEDIAKQTSDRSVPVEITPQLIDKALEEGRQMKKQQGFFRRAVWSVSDYAKGLTGIGQTSEQIFARRWLADQVQKQPDQRDATLQSVTQRTMQEQTELGQRYARLPEGMTVGQANRLVLAQDAGETRHDLPENLQAEANRRIKVILEQYANPNAQNRFTTDEQLVSAVNQYLLSDFRNSLPADLQKEFSAPEVASNIVALAKTARDNWQRYQEQETAADGQTRTRWENLQIKVLFGKGEWGGVRGKVKEGFLTERLTRRLAERKALRGEGILAGAVAFAQDAATYGGAYTGGWLLSGAAFGPSLLARTAGGVGGIAVVSYFKEAGIDLSRFGRAGFKGRYQKEIEQHSREMARGRGIPQTARIRQEVNPVLVDRIIASTTAQQLQQRIDAPDLSEQQTRQLLVDLAQLDARMRLTDMSGGRKLNFKVQNYIQFTEGAENEEYNRLRGAFLNGVERLQAYSDANPQFLNGQQQIEALDKYSALAEAQLRVTSTDAQVRQWLGRSGGFSQADTDTIMQEMFPDMNMAVQREQSLQRKEQILTNLRRRRGAIMAGRTAIGGVVATAAYGIPVSEGIELVKEGPVQYVQDWAKVLKGEIPITLENGRPVADLTPLQRGVLWAEQQANLVSLPGGGDVRIDGAAMKLEPGVTYDQANDALIDTRNGKIVDMKEFRLVGRAGAIDVFAERDFNGDGVIDTADDQEAIRLFNQRTSEAGITFVTGPEQTKTVDLLTPTGTKEDTFVGQKTTIPNGTHWVKDGSKYDLVIDQYPTAEPLINDASFDANGKMQAAFIDPALKHPGLESGITGIETGWEKLGTDIDHREWYSYNQSGSQGNELRLYDRHEGSAVVLDMSKMREGYQTGLNPEHVNVQTDVIQKGNAVMAFSIPGHTGEPILAKIPTGELRLDPTDTDPTHKIEFYNGKSMQAGEFAKMVVNQEELAKLPQGDIATELYADQGRQNVFNLGFEGRKGFIEAGTVAEQDGKLVFQSFATIQGSGQVQMGAGGALGITPIFELTEKITDTVTVPTFVVHPGPLEFPDIGANITFIPFPVRQNIEKSVRAGEGQEEQREGQQPQDRAQQTTPTPQPAPVTEEERQRNEQRLGELRRKKEQGPLTLDEQQELDRLEAGLDIGEVQRLQEKEPTPLQARFERVVGLVERQNNRFFVDNPPERVERLGQLGSRLPFFVNIQLEDNRLSYETNKDVVPWAWELGPEGSNNQRFINGEASTEGDSGLFGVSAASAQTPEQQARLYKALVDVVLRVHTANPDLLKEWLVEQGADDGSLNSLSIFKRNDLDRRARGRNKEEELLFYTDQDQFDLQKTLDVWNLHIISLSMALDNNTLNYNNLRQLEFLSHSVNVPEVIEILKQQELDRLEAEAVVGNTTTLSDDEFGQLGDDAARYVQNNGDPIELMEYREKISPEVGKRFDAHGMIKGGYAGQVKALDYLLTNGIDPNRPFHSIKLRLSDDEEKAAATAMGAAGPYDTGGFIVIGHPDKSLRDGIVGVLVNEHFYGAIPLLQQKFPGVKFIRADALPQALDELLSQAPAATPGENLEAELSPGGKVSLRNSDTRLRKLARDNEIELHEGQTAEKYWWQQVSFGPSLQKDSDHLYRGYVMVEPEYMPTALQLLITLVEERKAQGKTTDFKWLKMTLPSNLPVGERAEYASDAGNLGKYPNLNPTDPRIVIYGDNLSDIKEILQQLVENPFYNYVEQNRVSKHGGRPENAPRRPGTNAFIDSSGRQWRSLNFNDNPGYSEYEAADPNWRERKLGDRTVLTEPQN